MSIFISRSPQPTIHLTTIMYKTRLPECPAAAHHRPPLSLLVLHGLMDSSAQTGHALHQDYISLGTGLLVINYINYTTINLNNYDILGHLNTATYNYIYTPTPVFLLTKHTLLPCYVSYNLRMYNILVTFNYLLD